MNDSSLKTKLNSKWSLWFDDYNIGFKPPSKDYEKKLYLISSFDSIEVSKKIFQYKIPFPPRIFGEQLIIFLNYQRSLH